MVGVPLVGAVVGALVVELAIDQDWSFRTGGRPPQWAQVTGIVLTVLGLVIEVAAIVRAARRGLLRSQRRSPMWAMGMRHRSRLTRQVRRGTPGPETDLSALTVAARAMAEGGWWASVAVGLVVLNVGQALVRVTTPLFLAVFGGGAVLFALVGWQVHRDAHRGAAFLRRHASEPAADSHAAG
ncbi:hypothetical protein [Micromonospora sp. DT31]|uniref:hypothetical protein n=1 Tax=Micromonospora sp. DT31 TaxID=3393434 RepID=UPI003CF0E13C